MKMHLRLFLMVMATYGLSQAASMNYTNTLPGCPTKCGNLTVPYPFGIGTNSGCSAGPWFDITCNKSFNPPKAFLPLDLFSYTGGEGFDPIEVVNITDEHVRIKNTIAYNCYNQTGDVILRKASGLVLKNSYYTLSAQLNKLITIGCDDFTFMSNIAGIQGRNFTVGCVTICSSIADVAVSSCSGMGCCTTSLTKGLTAYLANLQTIYRHIDQWSFNKCGYTFIGEQSEFTFHGATDFNDHLDFVKRTSETVPVVLDWVIGSRSCSEYQGTTDYYCKDNSVCVDFEGGNGGYRCSCKDGYEGNPYLSPGCHDIDECADPNKSPCYGACTNLPGSFNCSCPHGYKRNKSHYYCQKNSVCVDFEGGNGGYKCSCKRGYQGDPYLPPGCHDIDECADPNKNQCSNGTCTNLPGSFVCSCPNGYKRDGNHCITRNSRSQALKLSLGIGLGFLSILIAMAWLYFSHQRRKVIELREKLFLKNGGMLLKQQLASNAGGNVNQTTKIFTTEELKKATKNFSKDRILGRGGYGTVYKGILPDGSIVAIKKSLMIDESQIEQFINEVVILTQINHRNVVKLLGCCLEWEVPLLVYECVSNGTLFHHIHTTEYDGRGLSWDIRLKIAIESAGALAYLHSAASKPIIHRDVKSSNILLDANLVSKISDFGASRLIPLDQTQVSTLVQGTLGYLDPEYFHTSQLTNKSDVYSFGIVLLELLTSKKPLCMERSSLERNLATYFLNSLREDNLLKVLDPRLVREASFEQLQTTASLVKRCLNMNGYDRPTMKEVAMELEALRKSSHKPR